MSATVMIIEDDPALLRGLKDNFETQGYFVRTANNGQKGLDALMQDPPDLLLLDLMLPKVNGYEICRSIRARKLDFPIIMLTAKGQEEDIVRGLELGADDYVTKPFSIRELLARVKAFLRRQGADSAEYRFGDCRLDIGFRQIGVDAVDHLLAQGCIEDHTHRRNSRRQRAQPKSVYRGRLPVLHQEVPQSCCIATFFLDSEPNVQRFAAFNR